MTAIFESVEMAAVLENNIIEATISGRLTKADYSEIIAVLENRIEKFGKIRLLMILEDFHGWTAGALWEDVKFDLRHFNDIERLAVVGDKAWEKGMAIFAKPFTAATVRYFDKKDEAEAREWIEEP